VSDEAGPEEDPAAHQGRRHDEHEQVRLLDAYRIRRLRAENPGPLSLSGTNAWLVGERPAFVVDPGPALPEHVDRLTGLLRERGGLGGIVLTHDHPDHCEAVDALRERMPAPLAAARATPLRRAGDVVLGDGESFGPFTAIATPGHAPDHLGLIYGDVCFTGDAVLGEGSVFIAPDPGALAGYLQALQRLLRLPLRLLCPGHGPPIADPERKLRQYVDHRLDRERRLLDALAAGGRTVEELLDAAWSDVPAPMRPVAAITLAAHLDKLDEEGRLPMGVRRPSFDAAAWA
jgi:glyoxylase-like metal-dependent hydrolase (beta-lactamase superfamily II)